MTTVQVQVLRQSLITHLGENPCRYATPGAAAIDLHAVAFDGVEAASAVLSYHQMSKIGTGIAVAIPPGFAGFIYARSGVATKRGLVPANLVGVIDSDYRGEVIVALRNFGSLPQCIERMERIAQMVIAPVAQASFEYVPSLVSTERGEGGFGSTGH